MQVTIVAPGSRGDVQPYVALGTGLQPAGHAVRVLASHDFCDLITTFDLEFFDMGGSIQTVAQSMQVLVQQGKLLQILSSMGQAAQQMASEAAVSGLMACRDTDLIIAGLAGLFVGLGLSEKLGVPLVQAHLSPVTPTQAFPGVFMPLPQSRLTTWANGLSHRLTQQALWQTFRSAVNSMRDKVLQLARTPFWGPFASLQRQDQAILYGYSPLILPPPKDWGEFIHVTGYWFLEPPVGWKPPIELMNFLESGPPPIYIGFGSMPNSKPEATTKDVLEALARTGQRGVLSSGWGGLSNGELPKSVCMIGSVPHAWLFPRMAAVVHHGGAGTTAAGLRAGVPAVITPFFGDQPFWAQWVFELGVGSRPIPRRQLTVDDLTESIRLAVYDPAMRQSAAELGERIRAENGVARAVAIIAQSR